MRDEVPYCVYFAPPRSPFQDDLFALLVLWYLAFCECTQFPFRLICFHLIFCTILQKFPAPLAILIALGLVWAWGRTLMMSCIAVLHGRSFLAVPNTIHYDQYKAVTYYIFFLIAVPNLTDRKRLQSGILNMAPLGMAGRQIRPVVLVWHEKCTCIRKVYCTVNCILYSTLRCSQLGR